MEEGVERKGLGTPATRASIIEKTDFFRLCRKEEKADPGNGGWHRNDFLNAGISGQCENDCGLGKQTACHGERGEEQADVFMEDIVHLLHEMLNAM